MSIKGGKYIGFCTYCRSYLLRSPVLDNGTNDVYLAGVTDQPAPAPQSKHSQQDSLEQARQPFSSAGLWGICVPSHPIVGKHCGVCITFFLCQPLFSTNRSALFNHFLRCRCFINHSLVSSTILLDRPFCSINYSAPSTTPLFSNFFLYSTNHSARKSLLSCSFGVLRWAV